MNERNDFIRDFVGVKAWHDAGYTGKRVIVASAEDFMNSLGDYDHSMRTLIAAKEMAPDAQYIYISHAPKINDTSTLKEKLLASEACVYWGSISFPARLGADDQLSEIPHVTTLFSAGNKGGESASGYIQNEHIYGVGAVSLTWSSISNGAPSPDAEMLILPAGYSSESDAVDFVAPAGLYAPNSDPFDGTSCSAPVLAGMCAIVNDLFIDKTGGPLTRDAMYQFLKDCSLDLRETGHDSKTGWGLPILPNPESVEIGRYARGRNYKIKKTNTGLVDYCKAQVGRPYWMGTFGQTATPGLHQYNKSRLPQHYTSNDFQYQYGKRVHDCIGLVKGYLWSDGPNSPPRYNGAQDYSAGSMLAICKDRGAIKTIPELKGTLVFGDDHVGVYIGNGEVIEARGHVYGVVKTRLAGRGWKYWGKCPFINYEKEEEIVTTEMFADLMEEYRKELRDNDSNTYSKTAREWAVGNGLVEGDGKTTSGDPNYMWGDMLSREQLVTVLHRFAKLINLK